MLGDASWAPPPSEPFAAQAASEVGRKRIAVTTLPPIPDIEVDPVCAKAAHDAAALLESLGHEVVEADPPWQDASLLETFTANFGPALSTQIAFIGLVNGREPTAEDMEPLSWAIYQLSKGIDSVQASLATFQLQAVARALITWTARLRLRDHAGARRGAGAARHDQPVLGPIPMADFTRSGHFTPFTAAMNITGSPAISLPLYHRDDLDLPRRRPGHRPARGRGRPARARHAARGRAALARPARADLGVPSARRRSRWSMAARGGPEAVRSRSVQHRGHVLRLDAEALGVGGPALGEQ